MSRGFRDEAELWTWMRPKMIGKWERVECFFPEGFFDVMGSYQKKLIFIERKISDKPDRKLIEPGQITFAKWMMSCGHECWYAWGGRSVRRILFTPALAATPGEAFGIPVARPPFWKG